MTTLESSELRKLDKRCGTWTFDPDSKRWVLHVTTPHQLTRAAGYLKFLEARDHGAAVHYRGQTRLYESLVPSLFRSGTKTLRDENTLRRRATGLDRYIEGAKKGGAIASVPSSAIEPLLQHYGIHTRWLDLVDNVWIALWFACHVALSSPRAPRAVHFERRSAQHSSDNGSGAYCYILLVRAPPPEVSVDAKAGVASRRSIARGWEVVDLRRAVPSLYVRPHAQHALLIRRTTGLFSAGGVDYFEAVVGVIRVDLRSAVEWLGAGTLVGVQALFPPPYYDDGFTELLRWDRPEHDYLGQVQWVGP